MATLAEIRTKYPQYEDLSDQQLADGLYSKFYSDMPRADFDQKLGLVDAPAAAPIGPSSEWLSDNPSMADLPIPGTGPAPAPARQPVTGLIENIGAGIDEGANALLAAPVDLPVYLGNSLINAGNSAIEMAGAGRPVPNIPDDLPGSRKGWERTQEQLGFTPPSQVVPADEGQRLARAAAEGVVTAAVPEALMIKAGQTATQLPKVVQAGQEALAAVLGQSRTGGQFARNMTTAAAASAGSQAAIDAAPEGWEPAAALAAGLGAGTLAHGVTGIPGAARAGGELAGDYLAPMSQGGRERLAGETLRDSATSPGALLEALDEAPRELIPGSKPTTFQLTGDMGIGNLERAVAAKSPDVFQQRVADQNAARLRTVEDLQPTGAPEQVVTAVRSHIQQIDDDLQSLVDAAQTRAQEHVAAIGSGTAPEVAGENIRTSLEKARSAAKTRERALWAAVDPDGTLALSSTNTRQSAATVRKEMPASAKPMAGEELAIFDVVGKYGDTLPFSEMTAVQSRLKAEMRAEKIASGESPAYRRMAILNEAIQKDLETAVAGKVQADNQAVAAGTMNWEDTAAAQLQRQVEAWFDERSTRALSESGGASVGPGGTSRSAASIGLPGTERQSGGGYRANASDPRLSGQDLEPNLDRAALDRLNTARAATRERVETFDNTTMAPLRRPDVSSSSVPARIFSAGAKSVDDMRAYRQAVGDQVALPQLQDYAIDRVRRAAMRDDGTFDPGKLAAWRRQHHDALRTFPALDRSLADAANASETMGHVIASRKASIDEAQRGIVSRIMELNSPDDVTRVVGSIFGRNDAQNTMMQLRRALGDKPEAIEGLRKAVVDHFLERFVSNVESGTSGLGTIKSAHMQNFVERNKGALRVAGFDDAQMDMMERLTEDLQRSARSANSVRVAGGSDTAQNLMAIKATDSGGTIFGKVLATTVATGGAWTLGGPVAGFATLLGAGTVKAMRQAGLSKVDELVRDGIMNPERGKYLLLKASPGNLKLAGDTLKQMYAKAAATALGISVVNGAQGKREERAAP